jgi:[acyl-carrier-protein] S-malonyltransferase
MMKSNEATPSPKIAFIFPGQGVQYVGMGMDIYEKYPEARDIFERASDALNLDLKGLCFQGPEENLGLTTYTQPAILTTSLAIWACLGDTEKLFLAGHSLGEFTAFAAGGALTLETAVRLVSDRGKCMQEAVPPDIGAMAAIIGLERSGIEEICALAAESGKVWPANYNCPGQVVISGEKKGVMKAIEVAKERGAKHSVLLSVSIPSHSPLMKGAAAKFAETVECLEIKDLETSVISNCLASPIKEREEIKKSMVQQLTSPVYWEEGIRFMLKEGVTTFIEVGPGKVLTGLIKRIDRSVETMTISDAVSVERIRERLS